jgi:cyclophilin family peptidyl-prolyl cis-trans isomerase
MTRTALLLASIVLATMFAGCSGGTKAPTTVHTDTCGTVRHMDLNLQNHNHTVVKIDTDDGCIVAELFDDKSPITVANFKKLVADGFYKDVLFHRIYKDFMVQTGGIKTDGQSKDSPYPAIKNEAKSNGLKNLKYTLSMARTSAADSATNQFFINTNNNCNLDPRSVSSCSDRADRDGYAVFGIVVKGKDIVDKIEATPVTAASAPGANPHCQGSTEKSCPKKDIVLYTIKTL